MAACQSLNQLRVELYFWPEIDLWDTDNDHIWVVALWGHEYWDEYWEYEAQYSWPINERWCFGWELAWDRRLTFHAHYLQVDRSEGRQWVISWIIYYPRCHPWRTDERSTFLGSWRRKGRLWFWTSGRLCLVAMATGIRHPIVTVLSNWYGFEL